MDRHRIAALGLASLLLSAPVHAVDVTSCGDTVADGQTGTLQVDLDCSADPAESAVRLGRGATLDMNGHAIVSRVAGVSCGSDAHAPICSVLGPGDISGGDYGIVGADRMVIVSDVAVHDTALRGIAVTRNLRATNVSVLRAGNAGISVGRQLTATNVTANDNAGDGVEATRLIGTDVTASNNGFGGVVSARFFAIRLTASNNGQSAIPAGSGAGIQGGRGTLIDSVLTGNDIDGTPVDVLTARRPHALNTTCDHSQRLGVPGVSWGICAAD